MLELDGRRARQRSLQRLAEAVEPAVVLLGPGGLSSSKDMAVITETVGGSAHCGDELGVIGGPKYRIAQECFMILAGHMNGRRMSATESSKQDAIETVNLTMVSGITDGAWTVQ